jgi:hypothetical protein
MVGAVEHRYKPLRFSTTTERKRIVETLNLNVATRRAGHEPSVRAPQGRAFDDGVEKSDGTSSGGPACDAYLDL